MALLQIDGVAKQFGATPVLRGVTLAVEAGEIVALLGPSGCGKTTLLRVVAGLEQADAGSVRYEGRDLAGSPPHRRNFGLMFQDLALFPHLTVAANIAFGLRMRRWPRARADERVRELLDLVGLAGFGARSVEQLSGGEQQRIALARSLAPAPGLLMLDEPLGALDRALRESLMEDLRAIIKSVGVTSLYVTHDQEEALAVADRVAVLAEGRLAQVATPAALLDRPATAWVARFLGYRNLLAARAEPGASGVIWQTAIGALTVGGEQSPAGGDATVLIPEGAATLRPDGGAPCGPNEFASTVVERTVRGRQVRLLVPIGEGALQLTAPPSLALAPGAAVRVKLDGAALRLLPPEGTTSLRPSPG